jgi:hypothetical protein
MALLFMSFMGFADSFLGKYDDRITRMQSPDDQEIAGALVYRSALSRSVALSAWRNLRHAPSYWR